MVNYREILRLGSPGYTQRQITASVQSSRSTVSEVLERANSQGMEWPLGDEITNEILQTTFCPERLAATNLRKEIDYSHIHRELKRLGVTLVLFWTEYCGQVKSLNTI